MKNYLERKNSHLRVSILSPTGAVLTGEVKALTLINELGPFDVVERHTNFVSAIKEKIIVYALDQSKKEIPIDIGIVFVSSKGAEIFLGLEAVPEALEQVVKT